MRSPGRSTERDSPAATRTFIGSFACTLEKDTQPEKTFIAEIVDVSLRVTKTSPWRPEMLSTEFETQLNSAEMLPFVSEMSTTALKVLLKLTDTPPLVCETLTSPFEVFEKLADTFPPVCEMFVVMHEAFWTVANTLPPVCEMSTSLAETFIRVAVTFPLVRETVLATAEAFVSVRKASPSVGGTLDAARNTFPRGAEVVQRELEPTWTTFDPFVTAKPQHGDAFRVTLELKIPLMKIPPLSDDPIWTKFEPFLAAKAFPPPWETRLATSETFLTLAGTLCFGDESILSPGSRGSPAPSEAPPGPCSLPPPPRGVSGGLPMARDLQLCPGLNP